MTTTMRQRWYREYSNARALPFPARPDPVAFARFRLLGALLRPGQRVATMPGSGVTFHSGRATLHAGGGGDWWTAHGGAAPLWAYQPIGAASLAASYSNLATPGTLDAAPQVAPTWDSGAGWTASGTQWIAVESTGYTFTLAADQSQSLIVRCSGVSGNGVLVGSTIGGGQIAITPSFFGGCIYNNGDYTYVGSTGASGGVLAVAGNQGYRDGSAEGGTFAATGLPADRGIGIFANGTGGENATGNIQAVAYYDYTLSAGDVTALTAAMAAL